ncbi:MAG: hypothetical protein L0Y72_00220 [Gemmataceae bacterium]|nr:hypothetical protein [Gemmataceae bacterium]MCI0737434.1 hypothetical protein [Gemmataceae bacterium]
MNQPNTDGQVLQYAAVSPPVTLPRIYYVNGIQTEAQTHAQTATSLSILTERVVFGVYNQSAGKGAGILVDLLQCGADWTDIFLSKLAELGNLGINHVINGVRDYVRGKLGQPPADPVNVAESIRKRIPERHRVAFIEGCVATYNKATAALFRELRTNVGHKQIIIAHSQGNLITADALWSIVIAYGEESLSNMQVYSLASPTPAWPLGIRYRRKVYGHTNDLVTLCDPHNWTWITSRLADGMFGRTAGDWRRHGNGWIPGLGGHDLGRNIALNFATTIRRDLGLPPLNGALPKF